ncbi:MAG: BRCT domain-containing protein, partial [Candidatus Adiutrix sp.]
SLKALAEATFEQLTSIEDIGPEVAKSIEEFFKNPLNEKLLSDLSSDELGLNPKVETQSNAPTPLGGQKFVLTGTLKSFTRAEAKARLTALGGQVLSSVSREVDFVVAGDSAGSKLKRANELGLKILTEDDFKNFMANHD